MTATCLPGFRHFMSNNKKWDDKDMVLFALFVSKQQCKIDKTALACFEVKLEEKVCNECGISKHKSMFDVALSCKLGVQAVCKECRSFRRMGVVNPVKDLLDEEWMDIVGWDGYYKISNKSRIKRLPRKQTDSTGRIQNFREKIIKPTISQGYEHLSLNKNGQPYRYTMHRLMAIHFIPNPENKPEVNHKNGIRSDNELNNLEWSTSSEQKIHAFTKLKRMINGIAPDNSYLGKPVNCVDCKTKAVIKQFNTMNQAVLEGWAINPYSIAACCTGEYKKHNGYKWRFA